MGELMKPGNIFYFDADDTVWQAQLIHDELEGKKPLFAVGNGLRPGLREFIVDRTKRGDVFVLTSSASETHTSEILRRSNLMFSFDLVISAMQFGGTMSEGGKYYQSVADHYHLIESELSKRMIIIGNDRFDQPWDIADVVFVFDYKGLQYDSIVLQTIFDTLYEKGEGHLKKGFDTLYQHPRRFIPENTGEQTAEEAYVVFEPDIECMLQYNQNGISKRRGNRGVPTIMVQNVPASYRKSPERF